MRRVILLLASVLVSVVALGSDSPKKYDDKTEAIGIEGTWQLLEIELNGNKISPFNAGKITYCDGSYSSNESGGDTKLGDYSIDPTRKPSHLNQIPSIGPYRGEIHMYIYQIDGDTLRIAMILGKIDIRRPLGFTGDHVEVDTYKRVK